MRKIDENPGIWKTDRDFLAQRELKESDEEVRAQERPEFS